MDTIRFGDLARRATRSYLPVFTPFLDPAEAEEAEICARKERVMCAFFGGYEDAERRICAFYDAEAPETWPISCLEIAWNPRFDKAPAHRDLLGALMGLGFERDRLGDIIVGAEKAWLFLLPEMEPYVQANLTQAGHAHLRLTPVDASQAKVTPEGRPIRETVSSTRLDAVLAAVYDVSRSQASEWIRSGKVRVNFRLCEKPDADLECGSLLSVRGQGRSRLLRVDGENRHGRLIVQLLRYE